MQVLVTGVAGFIGSHLAQRLLEQGHGVVGVDSFFDYYPRSIKENNLKPLLGREGFEFIDTEIASMDLNALLSGVDAVFHQAALAGVRSSWGSKFGEYVSNNVLATQSLLEASKDKGLKKFIYASSSSVYGDAEDFPVTESSPQRPISPYGVTKLAGENLASLYYKGYGVPTVSLRYFTVYGPRQRPDMAFHKFISAVEKGEEVQIFGSGEQTRDFTFISDAVDANLGALNSGRPGEIYNIGGGKRIVLNDAVSIIEEIVGKKASIEYIATQRGDAVHTFADISKAEKELSYAPRVSLEEGLSKQYDWLKEYRELYGLT